MLKFVLLTPKRHLLARNHVIWRINRVCPRWCFFGRRLEEPTKKG